MNFAFRQLKTTGSTLTQFTAAYEAAQFLAREEGALDVRYSFDNVSFTTINGSGGSLGSDNMRYNAPVTSVGNTVNLNLTQVNNSITNLSSTVSGINWADGSSLYLQFAFWRDVPGGSSGNSPVLSIDNVQFTAVPEPSSTLLMAAGMGAILLMRRRRRQLRNL